MNTFILKICLFLKFSQMFDCIALRCVFLLAVLSYNIFTNMLSSYFLNLYFIMDLCLAIVPDKQRDTNLYRLCAFISNARIQISAV